MNLFKSTFAPKEGRNPNKLYAVEFLYLLEATNCLGVYQPLGIPSWTHGPLRSKMTSYAVYQALENLRSVLILLIPVGSISSEKFYRYAGHVASCTTFPLQEYIEFGAPTTGGFENRNWNRDVIHLRYETQHVQSEWEELFLYQKPFAIVGIADCSVENDLGATLNKFNALTSRYRISPSTSIMQNGVVPKTCLAFELRRDQRDPDLSNFKVIPDQDFAHFNFYITHIFGEELVRGWLPLWEATVKTDPEAIVDKIFDSLYGPSENVSNPSTSHTALITPLDHELPDEAPKGRKRRFVGRIRKQLGDLCLFAGSPVDAMTQYRIALEISRSCSDWEWVGSTLESMASAVLSVRDMLGNDRLSPQETLEISTRLAEARTFYNRKPASAYLEAENLLRSAFFFMKQEKRLEMSDMLSKCQELVELVASLSPSNFQARIRLYSAIALVYRHANFTRKYAFYIQLICRLCISSDIPASRSHQLLEQVAPEYDITANSLLSDEIPAKNAVKTKTRREKLIQAGAAWSKLQASILALLIDLSASSGDTLQSIKYLVYMMREVAPALLTSGHIEPSILAPQKTDWGLRLKQYSAYLPPPLDTAERDPMRLGLGLLKTWKPLKDGVMYMHISRSVSDPLFLYRPNRKAKEAIAASANHVFCWPGHTIYFEVTLKNSLLQKAILEDVRLSFTPLVLTTVESRPGDIRTEVDWLPPIQVEPQAQTAAQIVIEPGEAITVKLSATIPLIGNPPSSPDASTPSNALEEILKDTTCKILLAPEFLHYSLFNCPFSEPMLTKFNTAPKYLLKDCLHYISDVPTVSMQDSSHPWISHTHANRDTETVIAVPSKPASARLPIAPDSSAETPNASVSAVPGGKTIQNLNIVISQLKGEMFKTKLILTNESIHPVDDFGLTIQENGETINAHRPNQVLTGHIDRITETISKALPLKQGETIEIPLEFVSGDLGLVQVSFIMEYRNNYSAENMWRKMRMDYSFKVVESIKPVSLDVMTAPESTVEVIDQSTAQNVVVVADLTSLDPNSTQLEQTGESDFFIVQLALHNKTMVSFHVLSNADTSSSANPLHLASVLDPWGTKRFILVLHRQTFINMIRVTARQLIANGTVTGDDEQRVAYRLACKQFLEANLKFSWKSYGNRAGTVHLEPSLITESLLDKFTPQRFATSIGFETNAGEPISPKPTIETPGVASFTLQANHIYVITAKISLLNLSIPQSLESLAVIADGHSASSTDSPLSPKLRLPAECLFSAFCKPHHLLTATRSVSWIGKNQNVAIPPFSLSNLQTQLRLPILFHSPGIYTINAKVCDPDDPQGDHWTKDISIVVTR